jgi:hypothetical protein
MATISSLEADQNKHPLASEANRDQRRQIGLELFRGYLLPDGDSVLARLGYSDSLRDYVSGPLKFLDLSHRMTNRGLEARPSTDGTGTGPSSLVESASLGIAEYRATLPSNINWHAKDRLPDQEINALKDLDALVKITMVYPEVLGDGSVDAIVRSLHSSDTFPGFGLRTAGLFSDIARRVGKAAVYHATRSGSTDVAIDLQRPGGSIQHEIWRELSPMNNGLHVFGRVPQIKS